MKKNDTKIATTYKKPKLSTYGNIKNLTKGAVPEIGDDLGGVS